MTLARFPNIGTDGSYAFLNTVDGSSLEGNRSFSIRSGPIAKRMLGWLAEEAPYLHGYWQADYADQIVSFVGAAPLPNGTVAIQTGVKPGVSGAGDCKPHARFWGINLLSELDTPNEFFISKAGKIYYWPALPSAMWASEPVVSDASVGVKLDGASHLTLDSVTVRHAKGTGISAVGVTSVSVTNCTVHGIGGDGVTIFQAWRSGISGSRIFDVGCTGVHVTGGNFTTLEPGLNWADGNRIYNMSRYKRTQQPGLQWAGVNNTYSRNYISDGPHNCVLGGGGQGPAANCVHEYNTLNRCAFETSDSGAWYSGGGGANAFVNRGNELRHSLFKNIFNTTIGGIYAGVSVHAIYLDDQMSGWHVWNNT